MSAHAQQRASGCECIQPTAAQLLLPKLHPPTARPAHACAGCPSCLTSCLRCPVLQRWQPVLRRWCRPATAACSLPYTINGAGHAAAAAGQHAAPCRLADIWSLFGSIYPGCLCLGAGAEVHKQQGSLRVHAADPRRGAHTRSRSVTASRLLNAATTKTTSAPAATAAAPQASWISSWLQRTSAATAAICHTRQYVNDLANRCLLWNETRTSKQGTFCSCFHPLYMRGTTCSTHLSCEDTVRIQCVGRRRRLQPVNSSTREFTAHCGLQPQHHS